MQELILNAELTPRPAMPRPGEVHLANESQFASTHLSQPLTTWAGGYADPEGLRATLDFVAPWVPVDGQMFEYKRFLAAGGLVAEMDDVRPAGGDFQRVELPGETAVGKAQNKGLTVRLDIDAYGNSQAMREAIVGQLLAILWRNDLRRAIAGLDTAATSTAKTWDTGPVGDPDADVIEDLEAAAEGAGLHPSRLLYGAAAWKRRVMSFRSKSGAGAIAGSLMTEQQLALLFGLDAVRVSRERRATGASAMSEIVGSAVYAFNATDRPTPQDPSNIKRFVMLPDGKELYRVFEFRLNGNLVDISVEHYSDVVVTATSGIRKLAIS